VAPSSSRLGPRPSPQRRRRQQVDPVVQILVAAVGPIQGLSGGLGRVQVRAEVELFLCVPSRWATYVAGRSPHPVVKVSGGLGYGLRQWTGGSATVLCSYRTDHSLERRGHPGFGIKTASDTFAFARIPTSAVVLHYVGRQHFGSAEHRNARACRLLASRL